jgi:hypothetical protein
MNKLFNKNFFHFTVGFVGIILFSFAFAAVVTRIDTQNDATVNVSTGN